MNYTAGLHVRHRRRGQREVMQQALPLGLVDEIRVQVIPVLLGVGTPLFACLDSSTASNAPTRS